LAPAFLAGWACDSAGHQPLAEYAAPGGVMLPGGSASQPRSMAIGLRPDYLDCSPSWGTLSIVRTDFADPLRNSPLAVQIARLCGRWQGCRGWGCSRS